jgi:hypothetical protein
MIYQELSVSDIATLLMADENANWSQDAAWSLAEYLVELSNDCGDFEFDRVAIRCEYSEYSLEELHEAYGVGNDPKETLESVRFDADVVEVKDGLYIVQDF